MMKCSRRARVFVLAAMAVHILPGCLSRSQRRIVDTVGKKSIIEYRGYRYGTARRIRYLSDSKGLHRLNLGNLSSYISEKYATVPESRDAAIRDFIKLHNPWETLVLKSEQDIPGFTRDQLEPDLRDLSLTPVEIVQDVEVLSIIYCWTRVSGKLKRYMFESHSKRGLHCCSCVVLQTGVGDAVYLQ
jgi:hypothetical protein